MRVSAEPPPSSWAPGTFASGSAAPAVVAVLAVGSAMVVSVVAVGSSVPSCAAAGATVLTSTAATRAAMRRTPRAPFENLRTTAP